MASNPETPVSPVPSTTISSTDGEPTLDSLQQQIKRLQHEIRHIYALEADDDQDILTIQKSLVSLDNQHITDQKQVSQKLNELEKQVDTLTANVVALKDNTTALTERVAQKADKAGVEDVDKRVRLLERPKTAKEIATELLPDFRKYNQEQLKTAVSKAAPEVLVEIARRLNLQKDDTVLKNIIKLVGSNNNIELMTELATVAGQGDDK